MAVTNNFSLRILLTVIMACFGCIGILGKAQEPKGTQPRIERHIQELINELPSDSPLRQHLLNGARGDGVRRPWMNDMQRLGIKQAVVWVSVNFDRRGKPKQMKVDRIEYFDRYERKNLISDPERLNLIRPSDLQKQLTTAALEKAAHGFWVDVPRPRPHPFTGTVPVDFYDDEWIPTLKAPIY